MARFRLRGKHYLRTDPPTEWEQKEIDQTTRKLMRKVYEVPRFLDPEDKSDCNREGECIVATKFDPKFPADIIFVGNPTADMEALDEEAETMLAGMHFEHPIESLSGTFGDKIIEGLEAQMLKAGVAKDSEINALKKQIADLTKLVQGATTPVRKAG